MEERRGRKGGNPDRDYRADTVFLKEPDPWLVPFCLDIDLSSADGDPVPLQLLLGWPGMGWMLTE